MDSLLFPPALLFIGAALVIPLLRDRVRDAFILLVPLIGFLQLCALPLGSHLQVDFLGTYQLVLLKVEAIRLCFAYVFVIIGFVASLYAIHEKKAEQHVAAFIYMGSSLGVAFAGDYFTLFVFWEIMAVASGAIILIRRSQSSREAGFRYLLVHVAGGAILMAGILLQQHATGSIEVVRPAEGLPFYLILVGFCLNAAVPPLSAWLSDAYPEASVTGSIYLTAYTTKTAVLVLALVFAGTDLLVWAGAIMTIYGVVFATMENDIRRLLAYHIISQVGYMVCGIGLGSALAINGSTAHAFSHILYKALLFMGTGSVLLATGRRQMTELGGIGKQMPLTMICYMVAGFSISGVPLFNGFISKSLIISAAADLHRPAIELMLIIASVGTFFSTTLKLPYYTFFAKDRGLKVRPIPVNMKVAMSIAAFLCFLFGVYPDLLYRLLPFAVEYHPYTRDHLVGSLQLLLATGLGFVLFLRHLSGHYAVTRDTDLLYRYTGRALLWFTKVPLARASEIKLQLVHAVINFFARYIRQPTRLLEIGPIATVFGPIAKARARESIGVGVVLAVALVIFYLVFFYSSGL